MLALFDNKCAKCHDMSNGLDLDHFFLPKMNGGNFALYHNDGYWVYDRIDINILLRAINQDLATNLTKLNNLLECEK